MTFNSESDSTLPSEVQPPVQNPSVPGSTFSPANFSFKQYLLTCFLTLLGFYLVQLTISEFQIINALIRSDTYSLLDAFSPLGLIIDAITSIFLFGNAIFVFAIFLLINGLIGFKLDKFRTFHIAFWLVVLVLIMLAGYLLVTDICDCNSNTLWANALIIGYWSVTAGLARLFFDHLKVGIGKLGIILPITAIIFGGFSLLVLNRFDVNTSSAIEKRNKETRIEQSKPYVEKNIKNMGGFFFPAYIPDWVKLDYEINCNSMVCSALDTPGIPQGVEITFNCKEKTYYDKLIISEFSNKTVDNYSNFSNLSDFRGYYSKMSNSPTDTFTPLQDIQINNDTGYYYSSPKPPYSTHYLFYIRDTGEDKFTIKLQAYESCYSGDMKQELVKIAESLEKQAN